MSSSPRNAAAMAQDGGPLIIAGREHAAYCFEVLSCYFTGESPASPRFADHHWCVPQSPSRSQRFPSHQLHPLCPWSYKVSFAHQGSPS